MEGDDYATLYQQVLIDLPIGDYFRKFLEASISKIDELKGMRRDASTLLLDPRLVLLLQQVVGRSRRRGAPSNGNLEVELRLYKARLVARVFHGIGSPRLPLMEWRESPFWGKHRQYKFEDVESALSVGEE